MPRRITTYSSYKRSSSKKSDNTYIYVILGVFLFAIVVGTIIGTQRNRIREFFTNEETAKGKLVYLYMNGCPHCEDFNKDWNEITAELGKDKTIGIDTAKFNLSGEGKELADKNNIDYAPAIIFVKSNGKTSVFEGTSRSKMEILDWANKQK
jgi:thioredoxin-related protein